MRLASNSTLEGARLEHRPGRVKEKHCSIFSPKRMQAEAGDFDKTFERFQMQRKRMRFSSSSERKTLNGRHCFFPLVIYPVAEQRERLVWSAFA